MSENEIVNILKGNSFDDESIKNLIETNNKISE
jgi:hypothetical protein